MVDVLAICGYVDRTNVFASSDGEKQIKICDFINCSTTQVVYMLTCPCGKAYIGKTKQRLKIRIDKYIGSIRKKNDECPLALHFLQFHNGNPDWLNIKGIYALNFPLRRGDFDCILTQKEKMWTFHMGTLMPNGLHTECNSRNVTNKKLYTFRPP